MYARAWINLDLNFERLFFAIKSNACFDMMHDGWMRRKAIVRDPFSVGFKFDTHLISKFPPTTSVY